MRLSTRHCLVAESMKIAFGKCKLFLFCSPTFCQLQFAPLWMVWTVIANVLLIVSMALWGYFCVRKVQKGKKQMSVS